MGNNIELSIIIPCYNVPISTLRQCVESMTFLDGVLPYEVLIIDDGSQKNEVVPFVESLGNKNFRAIRQENMGPGGARNTGIEQSNGEYITFVDADDYILYGPYIKMLNLLMEKKPDILCQGCLRNYEGNATQYMMEYDISPSCCSYFIRRHTLGDLRFTPHIFHEDEEFCTKLHLLRAHLITLTYSAYFYRYRADSITHNSNDEVVRKRFSDYLTVIHNLQELHLKEPRHKALVRRLDIIAMCYVVTLMRDMTKWQDIEASLQGLRKTGLYPLPFRWHGMRYFTIMIVSRIPWLTHILSPLTKFALKLRYGTTQKRAFTAHADLVNADEPEVFCQ
ncbi:MAG: glycosyltransferase family 2 protein [Bacteroidaceae bacterium]|nr:glycosyltransferase family 2 protein [Bacteroidaceae bacterium]